VYNNPLAVSEEEDFDMPTLPEPPVFSGSDKDDLAVFKHLLKMWFLDVRSNTPLSVDGETMKTRVSGLLEKAFPFHSEAHEWYVSKKEVLLAQVSEAGGDQLDALYNVVSTALGKAFAHILGDKVLELQSMRLEPGANLAEFASKFARLATETQADNAANNDRTVRMFRTAVHECAPTLASTIDADLLQGDGEVSLSAVIEYARKLARLQAMDKHSNSSSTTSRTTKKVEKPEVRYIEHPCTVPGHTGHSLADCQYLKSLTQQVPQIPVQQGYGRGGGRRGERVAMQAQQQPPSRPDPMDEVSSMFSQMTTGLASMGRRMDEMSAAVYGQDGRGAQPLHQGYGGGHHCYPNAHTPAPRPAFSTQDTRTHTHNIGGSGGRYGPAVNRGGYAGMAGRHPQCENCGRYHNPQAQCFGRDYMTQQRQVSAPPPRPAQLSLPAAAPPSANYASNADLLHFPSACMTVPVADEPERFAAATPVPFTQSKGGEGSAPARSHPTATTVSSEASNSAVLRLPLHELSREQLLILHETKADCSVDINMLSTTARAMLERTPLFLQKDAPAPAAPVSAMCKRNADGIPNSLEDYLKSKSSVYRLGEGFSVGYEGKT